jgi:transglutaminase-like putative cysteine protease
MQPGEHRTFSMRKLVKNSNIRFAADIYTMRPDYAAFLADPANARFLQFIKPSRHIESDAPEVKADVAHLDTTKPVVALVRDIFSAVNTAIIYDDNPSYSHQGALSALHTHRGVCTEFAGLFVAYCRALKIPARVVSGYWIDDRLLPTMQQHVPVNVTPHLHTWPEFYLPNVGWIPAEPTYMMTVDGHRTPEYHHFAALPTTERHLIFEYGLEVEHANDFALSYISQSPDAACTYKLVEQTATWVDDNETLE